MKKNDNNNDNNNNNNDNNNIIIKKKLYSNGYTKYKIHGVDLLQTIRRIDCPVYALI